ncbi:MAG: single-stranded DNA-binding protein [Candidatus Omnitrophica bacterium]|nr:single-stranded DNA-binding protein [Candidatus Omnitrophota bacterium]
MVNLNRVLMVGNLTQDPQLRYTPNGSAVATLRIAVNTFFKDKTGEMKKDTCFINVIVWGKNAEVCNQYLQKGRSVFVEGRLQSRSWQNNEGKTRSVIEVRAAWVQFMPRGVPPQAQDSQDQNQNQNLDLGEEPEEVLNLGAEDLGGSS